LNILIYFSAFLLYDGGEVQRDSVCDTSVSLYPAAENLSDDRSEDKKGDIPEIDMGHNPHDKDERDREMDIEEPFKGILPLLLPEVPEGKVDDQCQYKKKQYQNRFRAESHLGNYLMKTQ
jgi:hypothetical protein